MRKIEIKIPRGIRDLDSLQNGDLVWGCNWIHDTPSPWMVYNLPGQEQDRLSLFGEPWRANYLVKNIPSGEIAQVELIKKYFEFTDKEYAEFQQRRDPTKIFELRGFNGYSVLKEQIGESPSICLDKSIRRHIVSNALDDSRGTFWEIQGLMSRAFDYDISKAFERIVQRG